MNVEQSQALTWEDFVKKSMSNLKAKYPALNLSQIAGKIDINRSTLNRLTNEGMKPQLDNYIKIISGSGNGHLMNEALFAYDDALTSSPMNHIQVAITEKNKVLTMPR